MLPFRHLLLSRVKALVVSASVPACTFCGFSHFQFCFLHKCSEVFSEIEEDIEDWWSNERTDDITSPNALKQWLCVDKLKWCCPPGTYGKSCKPCAGGADSPCSNHGDCSGDGFRTGNGKCKCTDHFTGPTCSECEVGYYLTQSSTSDMMECKSCDPSCATTCHGPGADMCDACKEGYSLIDGVCIDVDECKDKETCKDQPNTYCSNEPGTFACQPCHTGCVDGCTGEGLHDCVACAAGFALRSEGGCEDIDECADGPCATGFFCENTPGSYRCEKCDESCLATDGCTGSGPTGCITCVSGYTRGDSGAADEEDV
eukprot:m.74480 g.74480  ORF g.74480 m.74480 type:complete len:315 (-) comp13944_c1_seq3:90-1034(-)